MENLIELKKINKIYKNTKNHINALKNINLTVKKGEFLAITGASGSGKSTLMNILGFLDSPDSGTYMFDKVIYKNYTSNKIADVRNKKIGYIFQSFNLLPELTAIQNIELPFIYRHIPIKNRKYICEKALESVGLSNRANHKPYQLSGGQKQRIAIARALAVKPKLLLADEPTGNLDKTSGAEVIKSILTLKENGTTVILITHDPEIALLADRKITIFNGSIVY